MTGHSTSSGQISAAETGRGLRIVIPVRKNWRFLLVFGVVLAGWAGFELSQALDDTAPPWQSRPATDWIWQAARMLAALLAGFLWLWNLAGREIVLVDPRRILIRRELFGIGPGRSYDRAEVENFHVSPEFDPSLSSLGWSAPSTRKGGWPLRFHYRGRAVKFGRGLSQPESSALARRIRERLRLPADAPREEFSRG